jgi:hypothetical protein
MWTDECYDEIRKGDRVYYQNKQGQTHSGKAVLYGPAGWVISCDHGPQVVGEGHNYLGHRPAKGKRDDDYFGKFLNQPYFGK